MAKVKGYKVTAYENRRSVSKGALKFLRKNKRGITMVGTMAGVKAAIKRTGAVGKSFGFRTKSGNPAVVRYGKKKRGGKTFKKTVAVVYKDKSGRRMRLIDTRIRKRVPVKRRKRK